MVLQSFRPTVKPKQCRCSSPQVPFSLRGPEQVFGRVNDLSGHSMLAERRDERAVNRYQDPEGDTKLVGVCREVEQHPFGAAKLGRGTNRGDA